MVVQRIALLVVIAVLALSMIADPVFARLPGSTPRFEPRGEHCLSPLLLEMAWQDAIQRAGEFVREGVLPRDVLDRLIHARSNGTLPFGQPDVCAQPVFEPFTAALIVGAVIL